MKLQGKDSPKFTKVHQNSPQPKPTPHIPFKKLKPEAKQEPSQVHGNMIEYATQELFKQKGKKSADKVFKSVAEKFNGKENMFLGGKVSITPEQLKDAVYKDKIKTFNDRYKDSRQLFPRINPLD